MGHLVVTAAVIQKGDKILLAQRKPNSNLGLKWEFPGGKLEIGETPEEGLKREIREELDLEIEVEDIFKVVVQSYNEKDLVLLCYKCKYLSGEAKTLDCHDFKWVTKDELNDFDLAPADLPIVDKLRGML